MDIKAKLTKWAAIIAQAHAAADQLNAVGMSPEAPILVALWSAVEEMTALVEASLGIASQGWLIWHAFDNGMGSHGLDAGYDDDLRPIRTLDDLVWLVEMERGRA